ncbi:MAG TPA: hypothetical protein VG848_15570 [Acetobacteraceae bacterium]|jgi:hypothetical protein|nr:hypothetical protein [Acetobacteraceae bacterium]
MQQVLGNVQPVGGQSCRAGSGTMIARRSGACPRGRDGPRHRADRQVGLKALAKLVHRVP